MLLFLQIIYYMISSIWPVFFIVLMYLIWKDVNHIAAKIAPEYYYEEDYEDDEDEVEDEEEERKSPEKLSKNKRKKMERSESDEFVIEDLD